MKKFLLPIVGLLLGGAAAQAEQVTCTYWKLQIPAGTEYGTPEYYNRPVEELFEPTKNEVVKNDDGTYSLKNYQNSGYDLKFALDNGKISYPEIAETGQRTIKNADAQNYKFHLTTIKEYPSFVAGGNIKVNVEGSLYSYATPPSNTQRINYLSVKEETKTPTEFIRTYEVRIGTYFTYRVPNGEKVPGTGTDTEPAEDQTVPVYVNPGAVIFDMTVTEPRDGIELSYETTSGSELFKNSFTPVEKNADGSMYIEYFAGSEASVTFSIDVAKFADGKAPIVFSNGVSTADPDSYQTIEGATFNLQNAAGDTKTGTLAVKVAGCYATPIAGTETLQSAKYKVYIDTKFGDQTGYVVVEAEGPAAPKGKPVNISYAAYNNATVVYEEVSTMIDQPDENTLVIYNFANSGYNIPFTWITKPEPSADGADGMIKVATEYIKSENTKSGYVKVGMPNGAPFNANISGVDVQENPSIYFNSFSSVTLYPDHIDFHITFGTSKFMAANFTISTSESGIQDVVVDENAPVEWFNLQGVRVNGENLTPGIYIKRQGSKAVKVLVR